MALAPIPPVAKVAGTPLSATPTSNSSGSFGQMMAQAVNQLEGSQQAANAALQGALTGNGSVTGAMIALTQAESAINVASAVRNNAITAYQTILNMQLS